MTKEVQRWADKAMFTAEPIDAAKGPQVHLLWMTPDPLGAIAAACKMYKGEVVRNLADVTDEERLDYLQQVLRTKLKAPFEFVKFHFLIEGVTRAFTHQMVRQRTAVYAQESLRFAVKEDMPVGLPPSLAGTDEYMAKVLEGDMSEPERMREKWENLLSYTEETYSELIDMGMPAEDARGLLPHNTLTRLHYATDLRALFDHAGNRLCTQAQFEWRLVFAKIVEAIRSSSRTILLWGESVYMANELTSIFKPVCFQTGKCEFKADFDRACKIRERVDAYASAGVGSGLWEEGTANIPPIKPGEWLLDHTAARER